MTKPDLPVLNLLITVSLASIWDIQDIMWNADNCGILLRNQLLTVTLSQTLTVFRIYILHFTHTRM